MKPGETVRVACGECQVAFDITIAPRDEWRELPNDENEPDEECTLMEDAACPFCSSYDLKMQADQSAYVKRATGD
jgi:hypothetical protein